MIKHIFIVATLLTVSACGKFQNVIETGMKGYSMICIDGTSYIVVQNDNSSTITPHLNLDGKPKGCSK